MAGTEEKFGAKGGGGSGGGGSGGGRPGGGGGGSFAAYTSDPYGAGGGGGYTNPFNGYLTGAASVTGANADWTSYWASLTFERRAAGAAGN